jgi:formylglycine-generating enzyme required for sulfatase activity
VKTWRPAGNILLVTSRPYGLSQEETRRIGLDIAPIQDLPRVLQAALATRWFRIQMQDVEKGDKSADELMLDVREREWLQPLAANPLMLTAMCAIYSDGGKLPQDRHQLYDRIVDSVLTKRYDDTRRRARARFELCAIAHAMHTGDALGHPHTEPLAEATFDEAELALRKDKPAGSAADSVLGPREAREDLLVRSGLLTARGDRSLAFYHLSVQEFLAAERVFELQFDALHSVFEERAISGSWRNTLSFLFGRYMAAFTVPSRPIGLLNGLIDVATDERLWLQLVVGDCTEMLLAKGYAPGQAQLTSLRTRLHHSMTVRSAAIERCEAGSVLGNIGDPRFDPALWYLPSEPEAPLGFLHVPGGSFLMGSDTQHDPRSFDDERPLHSVQLPDFYMSRYPVTVAQFRAFAQATGFKPSNRESMSGIPNHPVVWVSWHESLRYCEWLTEMLRSWTDPPAVLVPWLEATFRSGGEWRVMLPSEAEWEKAARGTDYRIFPWGDSYAADRANTMATHVGRTNAVGAFPGGVSRCGAHDMSGNVWELTRSVIKPYPYRPDEPEREDLTAPDSAARALRGGSFAVADLSARIADRIKILPTGQFDYVGFRVIVSRPLGAASSRSKGRSERLKAESRKPRAESPEPL